MLHRNKNDNYPPRGILPGGLLAMFCGVNAYLNLVHTRALGMTGRRSMTYETEINQRTFYKFLYNEFCFHRRQVKAKVDY